MFEILVAYPITTRRTGASCSSKGRIQDVGGDLKALDFLCSIKGFQEEFLDLMLFM